MAQNTKKIDYKIDYYRGPAGIYFRKILSTMIKMGELEKEDGLILDYGCGLGHFKKMLGKEKVLGYDIEKSLSEIEDYRKLKPAVIVLSGVLEHIRLKGQEALLREFLAMNPQVRLLVYLPTENLASKIAMRLAGQPHAHADHVAGYREINQLLEKYFYLKKRKYIFCRMAQASYYIPLKDHGE